MKKILLGFIAIELLKFVRLRRKKRKDGRRKSTIKFEEIKTGKTILEIGSGLE